MTGRGSDVEAIGVRAGMPEDFVVLNGGWGVAGAVVVLRVVPA